jgi:hypothetical protein
VGGDAPTEPGQPSRPGRPQAVLAVLALGVLAASVLVPFGENPGGCFDHCAEPTRWNVWHPTHNFGAVFLMVGVVAAALRIWGRTASPALRAVDAIAIVLLTIPVAVLLGSHILVFGALLVVAALAIAGQHGALGRGRAWFGLACGWIGVAYTVFAAPRFVEEVALNGGPAFEPGAGGVVAFAGYALLFVAALTVRFDRVPHSTPP